jgi:hypothetical protein
MTFETLKDVNEQASEGSPGAIGEGSQDGAEVTEGEGGGADESEFVSGEKKPLNRSAMMLFVILAVGGAGVYLMRQRTGPSSAIAADSATVTAEAAISDFMKGGRSNVTLLHKLLDGTAKVIEQFKDYTNVAQIPLSELKANPFHFGTVKKEVPEDVEAMAKKKHEELRLVVMKSAEKLVIQSIVIRGTKKACLINNTLYELGEAVDGFVIEKIEPKSVVVRKEDFRFELKMAIK